MKNFAPPKILWREWKGKVICNRYMQYTCTFNQGSYPEFIKDLHKSIRQWQATGFLEVVEKLKKALQGQKDSNHALAYEKVSNLSGHQGNSTTMRCLLRKPLRWPKWKWFTKNWKRHGARQVPATAKGVLIGTATWENVWLFAHPWTHPSNPRCTSTKNVHTGTPKDTYGIVLWPRMETTQMFKLLFSLKNWVIFV